MKPNRFLVLLPVFLFVAVGAASAQEAGPPTQGMTFLNVIFSSGPVGVLNWLGILGWTAAALPLGILSIVHCSTSRMRQLPLATKLLILGSIWVMVLGLIGCAQGAIYGFMGVAMAEGGAAQQALVAMNIAHALYSLLAALHVCQFNLVFLLISMVIRHQKRRDILAGAAPG